MNEIRSEKSWKRNVSQLLLIFSAGLKDLAVSSQCIVVGFQFSHFLFLDRSSSAATNRMQLPPRARFSFFSVNLQMFATPKVAKKRYQKQALSFNFHSLDSIFLSSKKGRTGDATEEIQCVY